MRGWLDMEIKRAKIHSDWLLTAANKTGEYGD